MTKDTLSARISSNTTERLEEYADERKISKSEATDRLLNKALRIESADVEIVPTATDGGTRIESIEDDILKNRRNYTFIGIGIAYIVLELGIGLPPLVSIGIGIPLIIALIYTNFVRGTYVWDFWQ